jgi:nucleoside phosphorylase
MSTFQPTKFCILCAKPDELRQVKAVLREKGYKRELAEPNPDSEQVYRRPGHTTGQPDLLATTCGDMGDLSAALAVVEILRRGSPRAIIFVGTAASLNPAAVQLGDVVVPKGAINRSYTKILEKGQPDYDDKLAIGGKVEQFMGDNLLIGQLRTKEFDGRALTMQSDVNVELELDSCELGTVEIGEEKIELRKPRIHTDLDILSCGMLVNSVGYRKFLRDFALTHSRKADVIDMESYGFLAALDGLAKTFPGHACNGIIIRGISDYAGRKADTEKRPANWKDVAVRNAAKVAVDLFEEAAFG